MDKKILEKGRFITFEGSEKSGKSTQAELLAQYLKEKGHETVFVREPGSTRIGEKIRCLLLDVDHQEMFILTEMLLYMAARAQLVEEIIKPALARGAIVLCDRFYDSTLAYQGFGAGLDQDVIKTVNRVATNAIKPDLTLLLDFFMSAESLRNESKRDRIEMRSDSFHERVKQGYFELAKQEPSRIKIVKVAQSLNETQSLIREIVDQCLLKKSSGKTQPYHC